MFLKRKQPTSNASTNLWTFTSKWYERRSPKALTFRKKSKAGRCSHTGRVVIWTKGSSLRRVNLPKINYNFRSTEVGFISTFKLVPFSNKLLALVVFATGAYSYFPTTESTSVLSITSVFHSKMMLGSLKKNISYQYIRFAQPFRKISNLEVSPGTGVQYVRSAGSFAKITRFDITNHAALIKLPSGVRKFFSFYSLMTEGRCALKLKRKIRNTRSGLWRSFGLKPHVRGVARNPIDHPHGGRTKSIRYPRTPWGKTTKFK